MSGGKLDLKRIRRAIRGSGNETIFFLLDDAISLLPPAKLRQLLAQYMKLDQFVSDVAAKHDLLAEVQAFQKACLAGEYYEAFDVNSKDCTQSSLGTLAWIADFRRCSSVAWRNRRSAMWPMCAAPSIFSSIYWTVSTMRTTGWSSLPTREGRGWLASIGSEYCLHGSGFYRIRRIRPNMCSASKHLSAATAMTSVRNCLEKHARSRLLLNGRSLRNGNAARIMRSAVCPCPVQLVIA